MKIVTFKSKQAEEIGVFYEEKVYPISQIAAHLPTQMDAFLHLGEAGWQQLQHAFDIFSQDKESLSQGLNLQSLSLLSPVPRPASLRDAYAFRQHVETSRANRGLPMIPEFDEFPVFYFSNHRAVSGPGQIECMPDHFDKLDFELEIAVVINKAGRNIKAADADSYIGGYMLMNDLSARRLQMEEMKLNLGPAKGKDFATALGPWLVSKDELTPYLVETPAGHTGELYNLNMQCYVNDQLVSSGTLASMNWTFAEIIERISYGVDLYPGDVIGSGTVGTGCFLELNGTGKRQNPDYIEKWLQPGDRIRMEATGLGVLENEVRLAPQL